MIIDNIKNMEQYSSVHPLFRKAFSAIRSLVADDAPAGRYEIDSDKVFAIVQEYDTHPTEHDNFELHKKYIDIQFMMNGCEEINIKNYYDLHVYTKYDETKDVEFYEEPKSYATMHLREGHYIVLFTHETHRTGISVKSNSEKVKKIVVKVLA